MRTRSVLAGSTYHRARISYRQNLIYPYFCWLMTINGGDLPLLPYIQPRKIALDSIERTSTAIDNLEALGR